MSFRILQNLIRSARFKMESESLQKLYPDPSQELESTLMQDRGMRMKNYVASVT